MKVDSAEALLAAYAEGERSFCESELPRDVNLSEADLRGADFHRAFLRGANLGEANLSEADFHKAFLRKANLIEANLSGANLSGADLIGANLIGANLSGADLSGANLSEADLFGANLSEADLSGATLGGANLMGAILTRANLAAATLLNADFSNATLTDAVLTSTAWDTVKGKTMIAAKRVNVGAEQEPKYVSWKEFLGDDDAGLTLYFNTRWTFFDRYLVDGVVLGVLGRDTDCRVVDLKQRGDVAIVRLLAANLEHLELVATALQERVWEQRQTADQRTEPSLPLFSHMSAALLQDLTGLRDQLDKMELRETAQVAHTWTSADLEDSKGVASPIASDQGSASAHQATLSDAPYMKAFLKQEQYKADVKAILHALLDAKERLADDYMCLRDLVEEGLEPLKVGGRPAHDVRQMLAQVVQKHVEEDERSCVDTWVKLDEVLKEATVATGTLAPLLRAVLPK